MTIAPRDYLHRVQRGFTLIELMLVIVIISVFAAMVGLSVGGISERRLLQSRDQLKDHLAIIRLESVDQGRVLGLKTTAPTSQTVGSYTVVQWNPTAKEVNQRWLPAEGFKDNPLPEGVSLTISPLQAPPVARPNSGNAAALTDADTPRLLWFGNGEATPVRLQLQRDGSSIGQSVSQPIGAALYVTATGQVSEQEQGDDRP